jgi:hypothetical protein
MMGIADLQLRIALIRVFQLEIGNRKSCGIRGGASTLYPGVGARQVTLAL